MEHATKRERTPSSVRKNAGSAARFRLKAQRRWETVGFGPPQPSRTYRRLPSRRRSFLAEGQDLGQCTDDGDLAMAEGAIVYRHACSLGCEGIVSKRLGSPHRSGRADCRLKVKNTAAPAVTREAEEEWN
jgi:hypothetical protein